MLDWNSASHIPFFDPTSSAASSGFEESTAPSGNLASAMRNWVVVVERSLATGPKPEPIPPASEP
jgi:hypothetical protein